MNILIVYDSYFGNTEQIAQAISSELSARGQVTTVRYNDAKATDWKGKDLLIVGSPTRAFNASEGIQGYLKAIPAGALQGIKVAAFDTRISPDDVSMKLLRWLVKTFGYAAKPIASQLAARGGSLIAEPEGFIVKDREGPLKNGEVERAAAWAATL